MKRVPAVVLACAVVAVAACSSGGTTAERPAAPPAPEPLDPVGTYTFATTFQGAEISGQVIIRGEPGSYTGMVEPTTGPTAVEIYSVTVEGQTLTLYADTGGDDLIMTMTFAGGDSYTGSWMLGFDSGEVTGERVRQ